MIRNWWKIVFVMGFFFIGINMSYAQPQKSKSVHKHRDQNKSDRKNIRNIKIKVVTKDMNLSDAQKKEFLPLYNRYSDDLIVYYRKRSALKKNPDSRQVVDQRFEIEQNILSVKAKYKDQFLKIISAEQLEKMYQGEENFREILKNRMKHQH